MSGEAPGYGPGAALYRPNDEWYTPAAEIALVRRVLGGIDLDPASCAAANEVVRAARYFTIEDDGLTQPWGGRVFLNAPLSYPKVKWFADKLVSEYEAGNVTAAILLLNNATDADYCQRLLSRYPACFRLGRVKFWRTDRAAKGARQGQVYFYFGPDEALFWRVFSEVGIVVTCLGRPLKAVEVAA